MKKVIDVEITYKSKIELETRKKDMYNLIKDVINNGFSLYGFTPKRST